MDEWMTALAQAFQTYRQALEEYEKKRKPTDGLLGFGHALKDEACHEIFDQQLQEIVENIAALAPAPADAAKTVQWLLSPPQDAPWPLAAQWMLRAAERHALPLIPFLDCADAAAFLREYSRRYKRWDRLPAQQQVFLALKNRARQ